MFARQTNILYSSNSKNPIKKHKVTLYKPQDDEVKIQIDFPDRDDHQWMFLTLRNSGLEVGTSLTGYESNKYGKLRELTDFYRMTNTSPELLTLYFTQSNLDQELNDLDPLIRAWKKNKNFNMGKIFPKITLQDKLKGLKPRVSGLTALLGNF